MVPKWLDKSAALSNEENIDQLRRSLDLLFARVLANNIAGIRADVVAAHGIAD
jgi:hypothetical protein